MSIYEYKVKDAKGRNVSMANYRGKVLLIVNTAPNCGLAPQYEALQALYEKYRDHGFEILDFFGKVDVNGGNAIALFCYLKSEQGCMIGSDIKWNFTKFLVDRQGKVVARFEPLTKPENIEENIKELL